MLVNNANFSLAYISLSLPWSPTAMAIFVGWNIQLDKRDLTIKVYISKLQKIHIMNSHPL